MNIFKNIKALREFASKILEQDTVQWQIFYFGFIHALNTKYIIARPHMCSDLGTYRVFIMKDDEEDGMQEVEVTNTSVHVSSKSIDIFTTYGTFTFNRETDQYSFSHGSGEVVALEEYSLLN